MSLLQLEKQSALRHDASSDGEDLAKGSGYILWTTLAAFIVVTLGISWLLLADRKPPVAVGQVTQMWAHEVHTINTPVDAAGVQTAGQAFDQVLVFAQLHIRNQSKQPIVLKRILTNATFDDGPHSSYSAGAIDYDRIFVAYPEIAPLKTKTLVPETLIAPGESLDGMVVSSFHISPQQWAARKDLNFTVQFKYHPDLTLTPTGAILEK